MCTLSYYSCDNIAFRFIRVRHSIFLVVDQLGDFGLDGFLAVHHHQSLSMSTKNLNTSATPRSDTSSLSQY